VANLLAVQRVIPADKATIEGIVMFSKRRVVRRVVLIALAVVTSALPVQLGLEGRDVRNVPRLDNPASGGF
jgi:hypothetical protein